MKEREAAKEEGSPRYPGVQSLCSAAAGLEAGGGGSGSFPARSGLVPGALDFHSDAQGSSPSESMQEEALSSKSHTVRTGKGPRWRFLAIKLENKNPEVQSVAQWVRRAVSGHHSSLS